MKTQQIARAGLCVALLAVSAWVSVPLGPIPFTLQTMALALIPAVLDRPTAILAVAVYLLLGAIGLPVFSGFSGGVMRLVGPTGGFLWGFLVGMIVATTLVRLARHFLCVRNGPAHGCRLDGRGTCHGGGRLAVHFARCCKACHRCWRGLRCRQGPFFDTFPRIVIKR